MANQSVTVSRQVFSQSLLNTILPAVKPFCITVQLRVQIGDSSCSHSYHISPDQTPQTLTVTDPSAGSQVVDIAYTGPNDVADMALGIQMGLVPNYTCQVSIADATVTVVQRLWVSLSIGSRWNSTTTDFIPYDTTLTEVYNVSIGQGVGVQLVRDLTREVVVKNAQPAPDNEMNFFDRAGDIGRELEEQLTAPSALDLSAVISGLPANSIPSGVVLSSAIFSGSQDLVCS